MAKGLAGRSRLAAAAFTMFGAVLAGVPAEAAAQISVGVAAESPSDALARNMKILGTSPKSFEALIGAGRAALSLGDTQAAAGFFGRAEEVWPGSPLAQAGMGAALAQEGDGNGALQYFARAQQRGATQSMIGCDRGLAYDLLGRHSDAQKDYRAALFGSDADEARRRLALSLAITGNKADALSTLSPLMARGDAAGARTRAFVLALTGDSSGAKSAMEAAMPGSGNHMAYFFQKLPALRSDQKAAAVNLGIFPNSGLQMASASPPPVTMNAATNNPVDLSVGTDANWWVGLVLIGVSAVFITWALLRPVPIPETATQPTEPEQP
jgi:Flp pilus assembly protein TadD